MHLFSNHICVLILLCENATFSLCRESVISIGQRRTLRSTGTLLSHWRAQKYMPATPSVVFQLETQKWKRCVSAGRAGCTLHTECALGEPGACCTLRCVCAGRAGVHTAHWGVCAGRAGVHTAYWHVCAGRAGCTLHTESRPKLGEPGCILHTEVCAHWESGVHTAH